MQIILDLQVMLIFSEIRFARGIFKDPKVELDIVLTDKDLETGRVYTRSSMHSLASHKLFLKAKPIAAQMGCSSRRLACGCA